MLKNKLIVEKKLIVLTFVIVGFVFTGASMQNVKAQSPTPTPPSCTTSCSEQYYQCNIGIPQCVESKIQQCRTQGGDESTCENARPQYEAECSDACYQAFSQCWTTCSPATNPPPKQYTSSECPIITGSAAHVGNGVIQGDVSRTASNINAAISFHVDGDFYNGYHAGSIITDTPGQVNTFSFIWQIPPQFRDGLRHKLYLYTDGFCNGQSFLVPFEQPVRFSLAP